ncbi:metalloprotease TldD [Pseudoalteromonas shioyasakiensis]|uniref:metalloprotease TldD n=1 Tax=Pseudoalteromonas TaxID=53246 RepID=UPI000C8E41BB|nr:MULTISPECIES: metalloprotease TldD [Pseudoalteromonas]MAD03330.1 metalloprotease TldD [Pseudoalteromonas sp.]MCP4585954.1 metalloprotease TldD [Pseudoalteromonas sp.]MCQ8882963.1 metalloprotease TldD [Pseudoalteromonas shioyasakiensis]QLE08318.1 metalloprotease TldD [Pseudoalteromonas shioyasakiensis]QWV04950.1 metalloprotease TldD [Pseudoalteromonas shioyasakiensis]|tara:strand:- start:28240 stop:29679 length:1440 start_codon:yes stop_codon:yes gene_type:complete
MNTVEQHLLHDSQLTREELEKTLAFIHQHQVDYADLYFQSSHHESWVLEDGLVKEGSYNVERGVGVRAVSGEKTGFSYSDAINLEALNKAATAARSIANAGENKTIQVFSDVAAKEQYAPHQPIQSMSNDDKVSLLRELESYIRQLAPDAEQVISSMSAVYEEVLIAASDGTFATDIRPLIRLNCSVLLEKNGRRERGGAGGGARLDYGYFKELVDGKPRWMEYAEEAVRQAKVNLEAIDAPAGSMEVVLGAGWPGVLLHEAVGHGLEGDFNRKGASAFSGKVGQKVASELCTVVDDGTIADRRGSLNVDDEGTPAAYNVLIENGILKGYMQDKLNARLMGVNPTGNARRESYAHLPMPRMTNTYMLGGEHSQADIISSVKKGIFAPNFGGGQVDITSGKFVFSASEAYLIENGKITQPIKGATLIGNGPEVMQQISMVGNDLALDKGVGVCGKDGQSVPVGVGQPSLKIDNLTVGGTA